MKTLAPAAFLMAAGLGLGLWTLVDPLALNIFLFFTIGHALIALGLVLYLWMVWRDLRNHDVL